MTHLNEGYLDRYHDDDLLPEERARADNHLAECAACRADLDALAGLYIALDTLPAEPMPVDLAPRVLARIASRPERRRLWLVEALLVAQVALTLALAARLAPLLGPHLPAVSWPPLDLGAFLPLGTLPAAAIAPLPLALVAALIVALWVVSIRLVLGGATLPGRRERSA